MPHNAAGRRLCVYITAVRLYCFRSYTELRFEPAKGLNVIVGANAAGKTNILESVFLAALGRSHRTRRDAELINSLSDKAYAGIELVSATGKHSIELKLFSGAPKQVFIDGQRIRRMGELMGVLNAVMFSPEDLSLVKDSPETRRRFMDMELCQLRPAYFYRLQQYNAALKQRTALLKTSFPFEPNIELLDMWDDKLAELGGSVMLLRRDFLDRLSTAARDLNRSITGNSSVGHEPEELFTYYKPSVPFEGDGARAIALEGNGGFVVGKKLFRFMPDRGIARDAAVQIPRSGAEPVKKIAAKQHDRTAELRKLIVPHVEKFNVRFERKTCFQKRGALLEGGIILLQTVKIGGSKLAKLHVHKAAAGFGRVLDEGEILG